MRRHAEAYATWHGHLRSRSMFRSRFLGLGRLGAAPRLPPWSKDVTRRAGSRSAWAWPSPWRRRAAVRWLGPNGSIRGPAGRNSGGPCGSTRISKTTSPRQSSGCHSMTALGRGILPSQCRKWSGRDGGRQCGDPPRCMISACHPAIPIVLPGSRPVAPQAGGSQRPRSKLPGRPAAPPTGNASSGCRRCWPPPASGAAAAARS